MDMENKELGLSEEAIEKLKSSRHVSMMIDFMLRCPEIETVSALSFPVMENRTNDMPLCDRKLIDEAILVYLKTILKKWIASLSSEDWRFVWEEIEGVKKRMGHWIRSRDICWFEYKCSVCGETLAENRLRFCPACGTMMLIEPEEKKP